MTLDASNYSHTGNENALKLQEFVEHELLLHFTVYKVTDYEKLIFICFMQEGTLISNFERSVFQSIILFSCPIWRFLCLPRVRFPRRSMFITVLVVCYFPSIENSLASHTTQHLFHCLFFSPTSFLQIFFLRSSFCRRAAFPLLPSLSSIQSIILCSRRSQYCNAYM